MAHGDDIIDSNVQIPYTKRTLSNGLDVIVHEDHQLPMVAVNLWYHVGSKNERPGRTGFAHLFEHLMFEGSEHHDHGYFPPMQRAGGQINGSTSTDRTNYWEVVPTGSLELALWMESDRMGYLLPALTQEKFANQLEVVLNERRQNYENRPYGMAGMALSEAMFAPDHPYHWPTIGSPADLRAASLQDVHTFFKTFYHPANASLALAGDIETEQAFDLAEQFFGDLLPGPVPDPVRVEASLASSASLVLEDRVELPRLYLAWHSPAMFADGDAALDVAADVLAHGKTSRLYKLLVYERRVATDVSAYQHSREMGGMFQMACTAAAGVSLTELESAIRTAVTQLATGGPTPDEMARALAQTEAQFLYRLQTIGGFGGKSDQLNAYNTYLGDPGYFDRDRQRYATITADAVAQATRRWLLDAPSVALSVVPRGHRELALSGAVEVHVS
jgi:zinc protease